MLNTPIAFFVFNRPDLTAIVFERIAQARPSRLLVVADGARSLAEAALCDETRKVATKVDWPCDVQTNFSDVNLGCRSRVSSGIDWVFQQVETAIILEDDCLPDLTFFRFCDELLEYYRDDERVMAISGDQFAEDLVDPSYSYLFLEYNHIWGWATWRRAWAKYDVDIKSWPLMRDATGFAPNRKNNDIKTHFREIFERQYRQEVDTWDAQWDFACMANSGLVIHPTVNLITNIGYRADATHTREVNDFANVPSNSISFPLSHPLGVVPSVDIDDAIVRKSIPVPLLRRIIRRAKRILGLGKA